MEVKASISKVRISPRKVRLVVNLVRNLKIGKAYGILENTAKRSSLVVLKLIKSCVANAVNNFGLEADKLIIKYIYVNEAKTLKRMQAHAHGRAFPILKRSSSITVILSDLNLNNNDNKKTNQNKLQSQQKKIKKLAQKKAIKKIAPAKPILNLQNEIKNESKVKKESKV